MDHEEETAMRFRREDEGLDPSVFQIPSVVRRMEILLATALGTKVVNSLPSYCCLTLILTLTAAVSFNTA